MVLRGHKTVHKLYQPYPQAILTRVLLAKLHTLPDIHANKNPDLLLVLITYKSVGNQSLVRTKGRVNVATSGLKNSFGQEVTALLRHSNSFIKRVVKSVKIVSHLNVG